HPPRLQIRSPLHHRRYWLHLAGACRVRLVVDGWQVPPARPARPDVFPQDADATRRVGPGSVPVARLRDQPLAPLVVLAHPALEPAATLVCEWASIWAHPR